MWGITGNISGFPVDKTAFAALSNASCDITHEGEKYVVGYTEEHDTIQINEFLRIPEGDQLVIASGEITINCSNHSVNTESAAASDDLQVINGGTEGDILILHAAQSTRTVVLKDRAGGDDNIRCGSDITLDNALDRVILHYDGSWWNVLSFHDNET